MFISVPVLWALMLAAALVFAVVLSLSSAIVLPFKSMSFPKLASRQGIPIPSLPERLIVGYANWNECNAIDAVTGLNFTCFTS